MMASYVKIITLALLSLLCQGKGCHYTEVSIVLDVSGTVYPTHYKQSLNFVNRILSIINISPESSLAGVTTFATKADVRFFCDQHSSSETLEKSIIGLPYTYTGPGDIFTNLRDGLVKGQQVLTGRGCGRLNAKQIMVLISDGRANRGEGGFDGIREEAKSIRDQGVTIVALGVGERIKIDLLKNITASEERVTTSIHFDETFINNALQILKKEKCGSDIKTKQCRCEVPEVVKTISSFPSFDQSTIASSNKGSCYLEKVANASKETQVLYEKHRAQKIKNEECMKSLKEMILKGQGNKEELETLLASFETCAHMDCRMKTVEEIINQRKTFLKSETASCDDFIKKTP
ncbi:matrilin-4-like [Clytia hemisphaerica]|uniref:matrilin-4-like n=1 Tax=Clytia hemisphaerica TaxID=252671 RepID=UPI0034D47A62